MGPVLRSARVGLLGVGCAMVGGAAYWLWTDITRNRLHRPTPIQPPHGWKVSW